MTPNLARTTLGDPHAIRAFLEFLMSGVKPTCYVSIVGILQARWRGPDKAAIVFRHFRVADLEKAIAYVMELVSQQRDAYAQVTPLVGIPPKRGTKEFVAGSSLLWIDVDSYKLQQTKEQSAHRLKAFTPPPSLLVDSGGGIHAYWRLDTFISSIEDIEHRNNWLAKSFDGDPCHSWEHILRIPGTFNFKDDENKRPVRIVHVDTGSASLADFSALATEGEAAGSAIIEEEPFEHNEVQQLPADLVQRISLGAPEGVDRSTNDWFVAASLIERGFTPGQVLSIFLDDKYMVGAKSSEQGGIRYATRTILKATREAKKRFKIRPKAPLHALIDPLIETDKNTGAQTLNLPVFGYPLAKAAGEELKKLGYKFVMDTTDDIPYVLTPDGLLVQARDNSKGYNNWISHITLFTPENRGYRLFHSGIQAYITEYGDRAEIKPWSYLDLTNMTYYLLADHSEAKEVCVVKAGSLRVSKIPNGSNAMLFFPSPNTASNDIQLVPDLEQIDLADTMRNLLDHTWEYFGVPNFMKSFLVAYMLAAPVAGSYVRNGMLPLLHLTGKPGHGKTEILKTLGAFLHGTAEPEAGTSVASARSIATRDIILPFDDYENLAPDLRAFILTAATGAKRHKMAGNNDNVVTQRAHILVALSSVSDLATDTLRRRAVKIEVSWPRFPKTDYNSMYRDKLLKNRGLYWSGYVKFIMAHLLPKLTNAAFYELAGKISDLIAVSEFKPLSEFLALALFIASELGKVDERFKEFTDDPLVACQKWLNYFGVCDIETLEAYDEFAAMLNVVGDRFQSDMATGNIANMVMKTRTLTGAYLCVAAPWMRTIYPERPLWDSDLLLPFVPEHTMIISGKPSNWIATLEGLGYRSFFQQLANPIRQFESKIKNTANISGLSVEDLLTAREGRHRCSAWHRLGTTNMFVQFVRASHNSNDTLIRIAFEYEADLYTAPKRLRGVGSSAKSTVETQVAEAQRAIEAGNITPAKALEYLTVLQALIDKDKSTTSTKG